MTQEVLTERIKMKWQQGTTSLSQITTVMAAHEARFTDRFSA